MSDPEERCAVEVGTHQAPYWRDMSREVPWKVCDRHRRQYDERPHLGPYDWREA